jgi:hypothetical protein
MSLPSYFDEPTGWYEQHRSSWLKSVQHARAELARRWNGFQRTESSHILDELLGAVLLARFIRHIGPARLQHIHEFTKPHPLTLRRLIGDFQQQLSSPILRKVFDLGSFDDRIELPQKAIPTLADELRWFGDTRFPLTAFSDFHQLCLASPISSESAGHSLNERRLRGVHFTPTALVDYLVKATFRTTTNWDRITILDPSCGSGLFLIAALHAFRERHQSPDVSLQSLLD